VKTYIIRVEEDAVVSEIEETAKIQRMSPEDLILAFAAKTLAPDSKTAMKFQFERQY
jgi:hypothetical protein